MINVNKLKKVKSNFPVMVGKGAISKKDCEKLIDEIRNAKSFDDLISTTWISQKEDSSSAEISFIISSSGSVREITEVVLQSSS